MLSIEETRTLAGNDRVVLWGGVPGAMFVPPWKESDVRDQVRRVVNPGAARGV